GATPTARTGSDRWPVPRRRRQDRSRSADGSRGSHRLLPRCLTLEQCDAGHPERVLDVVEQTWKRALAERNSTDATQQAGFDLPLGGLWSLPSRKVDRGADRERD